MDILREVVFVEKTCTGYIGAALFHSLVWLALWSWEWGAMHRIRNFMIRRAPKLYHETIYANFVDEDAVTKFGFDDEPSAMWLQNLMTLCHHGTGGLLMFLGLVTDQAWIWRHGFLTQLCGADSSDFVRVLWCRFFPPGPYPMRNVHRDPQIISFLVFHHSVSLSAGLPGSIYLEDCDTFRWAGCVLAGAPCFFMVWDMIAKCVPWAYRRFHCASQFFTVAAFMIQRLLIFQPMAWELCFIVYAANMPLLAKVGLYIGGVNMSIFNVIVTCVCWNDWANKFVLSNPKAVEAAVGGGSEPLTLLTSRADRPTKFAQRTTAARKIQNE